MLDASFIPKLMGIVTRTLPLLSHHSITAPPPPPPLSFHFHISVSDRVSGNEKSYVMFTGWIFFLSQFCSPLYHSSSYQGSRSPLGASPSTGSPLGGRRVLGGFPRFPAVLVTSCRYCSSSLSNRATNFSLCQAVPIFR